jgi:hypothetical protein
MEDFSNYREVPLTGRAPEYSEHELGPQPVDPSVLTDDRGDSDLLAFEKTWGHRLLAGLGVVMLVIAAILIVFCIIELFKVADVAIVAPNLGVWGAYLYGTGFACGILIIPPAIIAIYVAKHPGKVTVAIVAAIVAIVAAVAFFGFALTTTPQYVITALLYTLLLAALPVLYLVAALKIKRSL